VGIEFAATAAPLQPLLLNLSFAYIDGEYQGYVTTNPDTGLVEDLTGNRLNQSPRFKGNLGASWTWSLGDAGDLTLRGEYSHSGDYFFTQFNNPSVAEDGYELWNAFLTYASADERWEIAAWGKNLNDEVHYVQAFNTGGLGTRAWLAAPRTYGVRIGFRY